MRRGAVTQIRLMMATLVAAACVAAFTPEATASGVACPGVGATYAPPAGETLLLIGQDKASIDEYSAATGIDPGGVMLYTNIAAPLLGTQIPYGQGAGDHDMQYLLSRYPRSVVQIGLDMSWQIEGVALGAYDAQILVLAEVLKQANRPVLLRVGYEFDAQIEAEGTPLHGSYKYAPATYKKAFQRVVDTMRAANAANVSFVMHASQAGVDITPWYPGACYVDWIGVSIFKYPVVAMAGPKRIADQAAARKHPLMISESTPRSAKTPIADPAYLWANWYQHVIDFVATRDVRAWSYINANWDAQSMWANKGWGDTRVQAEPTGALLDLWTTEISKPRYLNSSAGLFSHLGYP